MDDIDKKILNILQQNAKITNAQLSIDIGLSPAPTLERVRKLEQLGIIKSYHARVDLESLGLGLSIFVKVSLANHKKSDILSFTQKIESVPSVVECHHITGSADFLLKILTKDTTDYQQFILDKLVEIEEIGKMESLVVLKTYKDLRVMPVL